MNFFQRRRYRQMARQLLHEARHARHMREDLATADQLTHLDAAAAELKAAWGRGQAKGIDAAADALSARIMEVYPARSFPRLRENVEILVVALAVAMGFRTYFIQPFKIPTGSMQPTLYGITVKPQGGPTWMDRAPVNLLWLAMFGEKYTEVHASVSGQVDTRFAADDEQVVFYVAGAPHRIKRGLTMFFSPGDYLAKGQLMASGRVRIGDHIFVDKVRYNFSKPRRGDIIVFSTDRIQYPRIRPNSFYIKRLAGLPGEEIAIDPPYLVADGRKVTEPYPFKRLLEDTEKGYMGYGLPHPTPDAPVFLGSSAEPRRLGPTDYLPLGDNTQFSLDGRYFGPVDRESLVGPAFMVYWPFTRRWGRVR